MTLVLFSLGIENEGKFDLLIKIKLHEFLISKNRYILILQNKPIIGPS